jgi:hypothetical protein
MRITGIAFKLMAGNQESLLGDYIANLSEIAGITTSASSANPSQ